MARPVVHLGRVDQAVALCSGALAGVGVVVAGARPTGSTAIDAVVVLLGTIGVAWAAATAPWWLVAVGSGAAALSVSLGPSGLSAVAWCGWAVVLAALAVGAAGGERPRETAGLASAAMVVAAFAGDVGGFGASSAVGVGVALVMAVAGLVRRPAPDRRLARWVVAVVGAVVLLGVAGLGAAAAAGKADLAAGNASARAGLQLLRSGEFEAAQRQFADAATSFRSAQQAFDRPWAQMARVVPVAAQHRQVAVTLTQSAAATSVVVGDELGVIGAIDTQVVGGRIDLSALATMRESLVRVQAAVTGLDAALTATSSPWLVAPLQERLHTLAADLDAQQRFGDTSLAALEIAPALLGGNGGRVYLVLFTTPAEARGGGGYAGNYAELTFDDGKVALSSFGRTVDLSTGGVRPRLLTGPADWLARYGPFGFQKGTDLVVGEVPWSNITMSPAFPSTAQVAAELYPQSGGRVVDGVITLDVFALQELVGQVGPIQLDNPPRQLTGADTAQFLLLDQYAVTDYAARVDMLEVVARTTMERLTGAEGPDALALSRALAPLVGQRRVSMWSATPAEQQVLHAAGADGALLPELDDDTGVLVAFNNASGSKIDSFLERTYDFDVRVSAEGVLDASLRIQLHNRAPSTGYPDFVIGSAIGLPTGTNRTYVTVFTSAQVDSAQLAGQPLALHPGQEGDVLTYSAYVDVPPESTVELVLHLRGTGVSNHLVIDAQPLVIPEHWNVTLSTPAGECTFDGSAVTRLRVSC